MRGTSLELGIEKPVVRYMRIKKKDNLQLLMYLRDPTGTNVRMVSS